ncbi:sialidase family protein [Flavisolibacter nicotianae]|uniref:sialidase family protein n=1 Tax=Flavisolibacter nicotianae TaxID=2364882 RepID=UPI000EB0AF6A|nr:sialidase family protein [Flavisolibacter nicotianae]
MKRFLSIAILSICLIACKNQEPKPLVSTTDAIQVDNSPGSCPYLTKDNKNNVVLSWIKQSGADSSIVCYAVSTDEGATFDKPIAIPGSTNVHPHGENMPKILFKPSGEIVAAWGAANPDPRNKYSGLVFYSQSFDNGKTWTKPRSLTTDTTSFDQRYFDMALLPNGEAGITWLDNRKTWKKEGSGLYYAVTSGRNGFQNEKLISGPCCQCCRTDLFIDKAKNIHVLYRAILDHSIRDMVHIVSTDGGSTFSQPQRISQDDWVISGCPHTGPAMTENKNGLQFTWFTGGKGSGIYYNHSLDNGKSFTARDSVSGKASKHCQITTLPNDNILIVWNENFVNGSNVSSRIGLEQRDLSGKRTVKEYITHDGDASFPVVYPVDAKKALIAYTANNNSKDYVLVKRALLP